MIESKELSVLPTTVFTTTANFLNIKTSRSESRVVLALQTSRIEQEDVDYAKRKFIVRTEGTSESGKCLENSVKGVGDPLRIPNIERQDH